MSSLNWVPDDEQILHCPFSSQGVEGVAESSSNRTQGIQRPVGGEMARHRVSDTVFRSQPGLDYPGSRRRSHQWLLAGQWPAECVNGFDTTTSGILCSSSMSRGGVSTGTRPGRATLSVSGLIQTATGILGGVGRARTD